jgi:TRAP-type mannitol/chloroaromatic compound transport system substrate-binding protein
MKNLLIIGLALSFLAACGQAEQNAAVEAKIQNYTWSLVTTWPKKLSWFRHGSRAFQ